MEIAYKFRKYFSTVIISLPYYQYYVLVCYSFDVGNKEALSLFNKGDVGGFAKAVHPLVSVVLHRFVKRRYNNDNYVARDNDTGDDNNDDHRDYDDDDRYYVDPYDNGYEQSFAADYWADHNDFSDIHF